MEVRRRGINEKSDWRVFEIGQQTALGIAASGDATHQVVLDLDPGQGNR
jgi:hypothetical protein